MMVFLALLTMAIGLIALLAVVFIGLFEAPWPVLVVLLGVGLFTLQRLSTQVQALVDRDELITGVSVNPSPAPPAEAEISGAAKSGNSEGLKYRGVEYQSDWAQSKGETAAIAESASGNTPASDSTSAATAVDAVTGRKVAGRYRGRHWERTEHPIASPAVPSPDMVYRGCKVSRSSACPPDAPSAESAAADPAESA